MVHGVVLFFNDTATTEIYTYSHTLSLHDALPISLCRFAVRVHQADRSQVAVSLADHHRRATVLAQFRDRVLRSLPQRRNALTPEHLGLADPDRLAIHARGDAPTGQALEVAGSRHGTIVQSFAAVLDDRLGQRMVAQRFDGDGQRQQLAFIGAI